jgi:5-methylcytosine-specific restriction endonuclease McrA
MNDHQTRIIEELHKYYGFGGEWTAQRGLEQDFRCVYCDLDFLASYDNYYLWSLDHIIPRSFNGDDTFENIAVCCKPCNFLKLAYPPIGSTREERIVDARRYVQQQRSRQETKVVEIRLLVRADNSTPKE